jgi:hypothetical protein
MNKRDRLISLHIVETIEEIEDYMIQANCSNLEDFKSKKEVLIHEC